MDESKNDFSAYENKLHKATNEMVLTLITLC